MGAGEWLLNHWTQFPRQPWDLARPDYWQTPKSARVVIDEPDGPQLGTAFSWQDGNTIRQGWAGH